MVSDSDLVTRLREILQTSNLDTATAGSVRRQLEEDFGIDLSDRKSFIREQIDIYLRTLEEGSDVNADDEKQTQNDAVEEENTEEEDENEGRNEGKKVKKKGGGFTKLCSLSQPLQDLLGEPVLARTEVVKRLWNYIRSKDLQDPKNRRNIICDEALHAIFRVNTINMFQMNKALSKHIWPLTPEDENLKSKINDEDVEGSSSEGERKEEDKDDEEEEEEEEEKEEVKKEGSCSSKKVRSTKADKNVKKKGGGFTKLCSLSPELKDFIGVSALARTEVVKKLWEYIRKNNLQDPSNKRNIICDESLKALFQVDSIDMFQMNKALSRHILPLNEEDAQDVSSQKETSLKHEKEEASDDSSQKETTHKHEREEDSDDESKPIEKRQKKGNSGFLSPLPLSDALVKFFGTGENSLSRADVVKRMWEYIKQNDLQDPSDKRRVICDDKLKELFEVDSFNGFSVSKLLTAHFIKE